LIIEINSFNVFFDEDSKYEIGFPLSFTVFAVEGKKNIISDPVISKLLYSSILFFCLLNCFSVK
jgi:hypothetical protein